jgi:thermosome
MRDNVQPIFILPEDSRRTRGRDAQGMNIQAAKLVAEAVRTTLGPKGMDKMLVDSMGDVVVTNDGVTILREMNVEHPAAKMIVEIAKTQEDEVGDGTTTAVIIAGELLRRAEDLIDQEIHPTIIAKGYRLAGEKALQALNHIAIELKPNDQEMLKKICLTAMTGKGAEHAKVHLANLIVEAVHSVMRTENGTTFIDKDAIKIEKKVGGAVEDSELIQGIVLDKERVHPSMPTKIKDAKIALYDGALEVKNTEIDAKISITDPEKMQGFLDMEERMLRNMVDKITKAGANVVLCQKGIDDMAMHFLAKNGIYACRRVKKSDMERLTRATKGTIISNLADLSPKDLGKAGLVEELKVGDENMTYIRDCVDAKAVTLLVRGGTDHVVDEVKRALDDSVGDTISALGNKKLVAGAGSTEMEIAKELRKYGESLSGREQLAVMAFAQSLEVIPRTLAENAGLDPIDVVAALKAAHDKGQTWAGIDVFTGKTIDAWKDGIIEPLKIKTQAIASASEVAIMILRIDDVIAAGKTPAQGPRPPSDMD